MFRILKDCFGCASTSVEEMDTTLPPDSPKAVQRSQSFTPSFVLPSVSEGNENESDHSPSTSSPRP